MLRHLYIRDFAIVQELSLELEAGMSALTGETGAGKSILLDAIGLCLGDRADSGAVASDADRSELVAGFDVADNPAARDWLAEHELGADDDCLLRRVVQRNGRSQGFINGRPVPAQMLDTLGRHLVDIHGQHAHQSLLRPDPQRELLDHYAGLDAQLREVAAAHRACRELRSAIAELEGGQDSYQDRLELLRFQVGELEGLALGPGELAELDAEQRRLASAGQLIGACQGALAALYDDDAAAQSLVAGAARALEEFADVDPQLVEAVRMFRDAEVQLQEGCESLRRFADHLELDPERLAFVEERLSAVHDMARKYRVRPEELPERLTRLRAELEALDGAGERLGQLRGKLEQRERQYSEAAERLSRARREAAAELSRKVTALIRELGMPGGELIVAVEARPPERAAAHGLDDVRLDVRSNPDRPAGPLAKVASGGELSRIGLALEVATAGSARIPTLIFDEADAGIGGGVAEVVGRKLRELGEAHQVLCVTHLPQVAAQAHHQFRVAKQLAGGRTRTSVDPLADTQRLDEIARMLGGVEITEHTLNHAREMLARAG